VEGAKNWGRIKETLHMMDDARAAGLDVLADQYPYTAFMTGLSVIILPAWAQGGGPMDVTARLSDPEARAKIVGEIRLNPPVWHLIQIGIARKRRDTQGLTLQALGEREGKDPIDAALDLLLDEEGAVAAAYFAISEDDVKTVMRDPHTMIGSDAVASSPIGFLAEDKTHPRSYGAFSRVLAEYVRKKSVLTLAEAIRRMTSLPARRLKLGDRGHLSAGARADLVVFDPDTVQDRATFEDPHLFPSGIEHVMVNGQFAIRSGVQTEARAGRVLRHNPV
jgi:N-acyl-D-amino-acid deacylase